MNSDGPVAAETVSGYYDAALPHRLRDFLYGNPRVEAAWRFLCAQAPAQPRRVLEVGCGGGYVAHLMKARWPEAEVIATDLSPASIAGATALFARPGLRYLAGGLEVVPDEPYDLIVLMDVIEHVPQAARPTFDAQLSRLLAVNGRLVLTYPTPRFQAYLRQHEPALLQPVDEDITVASLAQLATATGSELIHLSEVSIWRPGDYAHAALARQRPPLGAITATLADKLYRRWLPLARIGRRWRWQRAIARLIAGR